VFLDHGERNLETLNIKDEDGVRLVEMDRPEALNAFSSQLMMTLLKHFLKSHLMTVSAYCS
jgi:enoyl-CoA hydratase/carnithine racemase